MISTSSGFTYIFLIASIDTRSASLISLSSIINGCLPLPLRMARRLSKCLKLSCRRYSRPLEHRYSKLRQILILSRRRYSRPLERHYLKLHLIRFGLLPYGRLSFQLSLRRPMLRLQHTIPERQLFFIIFIPVRFPLRQICWSIAVENAGIGIVIIVSGAVTSAVSVRNERESNSLPCSRQSDWGRTMNWC